MLGWKVEFDANSLANANRATVTGANANIASASSRREIALSQSNSAVFQNGVCIVPFDSKLDEASQKFFSQLLTAFGEAVKHRQVSGFEQTRAAIEAISAHMPLSKQLSSAQLQVAQQCALHALAGYGVLDFLLAEPSIEEISVVGIGPPIFVYHRELGWLQTNCFFTDFEVALEAANKMARPLGRRLAYQSPRVNAVLADGSRLHASISPVCVNGIEITIRKFSQEPYSAAALVASSTISADAAAALWLALYSDASLIVAGNTGSGKTTTLNSLFSFLPPWERIVVVEETPEVSLPQKHVVRLASNEELKVSLKQLVLDTLRMRPDRLVVGEVRSKKEAEALLDCLLGGQARGTYCTLHAKTSGEALDRLRSLTGSSDGLSAIDLVLVQRRMPKYDSKAKKAWEERKVTEIALQEDGNLVPLFAHDFSSNSLKKCPGLSKLFERIAPTYSLSAKELEKEFEQRSALMGGLSKQQLSFNEFTSSVQQYAYPQRS